MNGRSKYQNPLGFPPCSLDLSSFPLQYSTIRQGQLRKAYSLMQRCSYSSNITETVVNQSLFQKLENRS